MLSPQFDIYEQIAKVVNGKVADIGCGTGFGTHLLTRSAQYVRGFDVDDKAVAFAKRCFENHAINFEVASVGDAAERYEDRYDFVVMVDVIEHIREDSLAIQCCKKLLRNGGTLSGELTGNCGTNFDQTEPCLVSQISGGDQFFLGNMRTIHEPDWEWTNGGGQEVFCTDALGKLAE